MPHVQVRNQRLGDALESPALATQLVSGRAATGSQVSLSMFAKGQGMVPGGSNKVTFERVLCFLGRVRFGLIAQFKCVKYLH